MTFLSRYRWSVLSIIAGVVGYIVSYILFPQAFSILSINLTSNKNEIVIYAQELAKSQDFLSRDFYNSVSFETDSQAKTFIEREYGKDALFSIIENNFYQPYLWHVRHFIPDAITEQDFFITPDKKPYGFSTKIPDSYVSENISQEKAATLAREASSFWNIDLNNYILVAPSHQTAPSGRIDHTFIYEHTNQNLGEGTYRVKIIVSGNQVSTVRQYIQVPESFIKKYQEECSLNNFLASISMLLMIFLFILIGCGCGGFYLIKNNFLIIRPALRIGIIAGIMTLLNQINYLPLLWMSYQTTQSVASFFTTQLGIALIMSLKNFGMFFFVLLIAEGLTRQALKKHPQFWLSLTHNKATDMTIQQIIMGYSATGFLLSFVVLFYFCMTRFFDWWIPVDTLINPNMLATYVPCFSPIFAALSAGVIEESLFRAIPLAGSILLGRFFNKEKLFLAFGFVLQVLIFGAAHANYPSQPYYARLVELIIPSSLFGGIYLVFGLFPSIIAHSLYDLILMALPLFVSDAKNIFFQQSTIVVCGLIPIIISAYYSFKGNTNKHATLNIDWTKPAQTDLKAEEHQASKEIHLSRRRVWICNTIGFISLFLIIFLGRTIDEKTYFKKDEFIPKPILMEIPEKRAIPFITNDANNNYQHLQYRYVWQKSPELYQELMNKGFLHVPHWAVRYTQFHGPITERTHETYLFYKGQDIYRKKIILPENKALPSLSEEHALKLAYETLYKEYGISKEDVTIIEKNSHKQVARLDWNFIFEITNKPYLDISQRIVITLAGNIITDYAQYIFIPEPWIRENARQDSLLGNLLLILWILFVGILLMGFYKAAQSIPFNTIDWKNIIIASSMLFILGLLNFLNNWDISFASFLSIESIITQTLKLFLGTIVFLIIKSGLYSIVLFFCLRSHWPTYLGTKTKSVLSSDKGFWNKLKTNWSFNNRYIIPAVSAGMVPMCLLLVGRYFTFAQAPFISSLYYQHAFFPSYAIIYDTLMTFLFFSVILLLANYAIAFITSEWKKNYFAGFLIQCIMGTIIALKISIFTPITVYSLALYGLLLGTGFIIIHHLITQYDRYPVLFISYMLTIVAIQITLPSCYTFIVFYCASTMFASLRSMIDE